MAAGWETQRGIGLAAAPCMRSQRPYAMLRLAALRAHDSRRAIAARSHLPARAHSGMVFPAHAAQSSAVLSLFVRAALCDN